MKSKLLLITSMLVLSARMFAPEFVGQGRNFLVPASQLPYSKTTNKGKESRKTTVPSWQLDHNQEDLRQILKKVESRNIVPSWQLPDPKPTNPASSISMLKHEIMSTVNQQIALAEKIASIENEHMMPKRARERQTDKETEMTIQRLQMLQDTQVSILKELGNQMQEASKAPFEG